MSEKNLFPAELRVLLLAGAVGVMVTAGWLAAMAARGAQRSFRYAYGRAAAAAVCCADPVRQYWRIAGHGDPGEKAPQLNK